MQNQELVAKVNNEIEEKFEAVSYDLMTPISDECFYSIIPQTEEEKIKVYNALNSPDVRLGDCINETILLKDVLVEMVCLKDKDGFDTKAPRIILIDDKGKSYACVSFGILSAIQRLRMFFGKPTWAKPLKVKVLQVTTSNGNKVLSLTAIK